MEQEHPLITISGPPASGTSTLSGNIAESLNFEVVNGGDIFRRVASDKEVTLAELNKLSEDDDSIDKEIDQRLESIIEDHLSGEREPEGDGLVVESRLAGWHANSRADLSIYLDAPAEIRAQRISDRDETVEELKGREESEAKRYMNHYGIDVHDLSIYDVVIDTHDVSVPVMTERVIAKLKERTELYSVAHEN